MRYFPIKYASIGEFWWFPRKLGLLLSETASRYKSDYFECGLHWSKGLTWPENRFYWRELFIMKRVRSKPIRKSDQKSPTLPIVSAFVWIGVPVLRGYPFDPIQGTPQRSKICCQKCTVSLNKGCLIASAQKNGCESRGGAPVNGQTLDRIRRRLLRIRNPLSVVRTPTKNQFDIYLQVWSSITKSSYTGFWL